MTFTPADLAQVLGNRAADTYLVGGFLRDLMLDRPSRDIDIVVAGDAMIIGHLLASELSGRPVVLDAERGIMRIVLQTSDGDWHIDLSPYNGDIVEDLARRDFTIDAMAFPLSALADNEAVSRESPFLIDPFGGCTDLEQRLVRAVTEKCFKEDGLRLLRAVRLSAELGFELEQETAALARKDAEHLKSAAAERQRDEFIHILETPRAGYSLNRMDNLDLLCLLIPELAVAKDVTQPEEHYYDVFRHSLEAVAAVDLILAENEPLEPTAAAIWQEVWTQFAWLPELRSRWQKPIADGFTRGAFLKLAALLHDIAKPHTRTVDANGRIRFFGHDQKGAHMATEIMRRLRFSNIAIHLVSTMVEEHLRPPQMAQTGLPSRRVLFRYFRDTGDAATDVLFLSLADHLAQRGPNVDLLPWRRHVALVNYIQANRYQEELAQPQRLVTGDDLMSELDLPAGPAIGRLLAILEEAQAEGKVKDRDEALAMARKELTRIGARHSQEKSWKPRSSY